MKKPKKKAIVNKRAHFDYELKDSYIAGIELFGPEVSSIRKGQVSLRSTYVTVQDNAATLINMAVQPLKTNAKHFTEAMHTRNRKLLLKQKEIDQLNSAKKQGLSIIPTKLLTEGRYIKLMISIGRGKKQYDKRETIKKREQERKQASY